MAYVKFLDTGKIFKATVIPISSAVIKIIYDSGETYENTSGFLFSNREDFKTVLGRYEDYKTVYMLEDNELYLSSDESVYPVVSEESNPTLKERVIKLEEENTLLREQNQLLKIQIATTQEVVDFLLLK